MTDSTSSPEIPSSSEPPSSNQASSSNESQYRAIDGRSIADRIHGDVEREVQELRAAGHVPHLVAVQVGSDPGTEAYVRRQEDRFSRLGIQYSHQELEQSISSETLFNHLDRLNEDSTVTGIIMTMPIPPGIPVHKIQEKIRPEKDVEGVNPQNLGRLIQSQAGIGPCTALAVMTALEATGVPMKGKDAVIVGRSAIVGKPVGLLLLQERATVTTCHTATRELSAHTRRADILIVAAGKPNIVTGDMVREGVIVIDVGINRLPGPPPRTVGDVDFESVAPKSSWITPVPGGIGPITVAILARNTVRCARTVFEK